MGVNVNKWGNQLWTCIHYIALNYPDNPSDEDKINYKNFFMSLKDILPCNICKEHYEDILLILPLTNDSLNNSTTLFKWTVDLHNKVNILNDKPFFSYEDAKSLYIDNTYITDDDYQNSSNSKNNIVRTIFSLIILIIILKIILA